MRRAVSNNVIYIPIYIYISLFKTTCPSSPIWRRNSNSLPGRCRNWLIRYYLFLFFFFICFVLFFWPTILLALLCVKHFEAAHLVYTRISCTLPQSIYIALLRPLRQWQLSLYTHYYFFFMFWYRGWVRYLKGGEKKGVLAFFFFFFKPHHSKTHCTTHTASLLLCGL